jgi:hypothetical protein
MATAAAAALGIGTATAGSGKDCEQRHSSGLESESQRQMQPTDDVRSIDQTGGYDARGSAQDDAEASAATPAASDPALYERNLREAMDPSNARFTARATADELKANELEMDDTRTD